MKVAIALVHHPVLDRGRNIITTAITNLDLHDMARSARTYGVSDFFVAHPVAAQRELAERVQAHWVSGSGADRIPTREPALRLLRVVPDLADVYAALGGRDAIDLYVTSAAWDETRASRALSYEAARQRMAKDERIALLVFGTGWGLAPAVLDAADLFLPPIDAAVSAGYNHLSVRAACAIVLDRLLGPVRS